MVCLLRSNQAKLLKSANIAAKNDRLNKHNQEIHTLTLPLILVIAIVISIRF